MSSSKIGFKKITIKIQGGLGNQLFQFFAGLKIALDNNKTLNLDTSIYGLYSNSQNHELPFLLKYNKIASKFQVLRGFPRIRREVHIEIARLPVQLRNTLGYFQDHELMNISKSRTNIYLDGYYQDLALLPPFHVIDEYLQLNSSNYNSILKEIELIQDIQPILLHVRRGDYLTKSAVYHELTKNYYAAGIRYLESRLGKREVWLISDDPKGALHLLGNECAVDRVLDPLALIDPDQYLEIMSHCKGIVTANSTFSWWGAYLGYGRGTTKAVVMPSSFRQIETISQYKTLGVNGWKILDVKGDSI